MLEQETALSMMEEEAVVVRDIFRFLQLLCEGHNLAFQNYLRFQPGSNHIVNIIVNSVDYLMRLQESAADTMAHYSSMRVIDLDGLHILDCCILIVKQVFKTLTEYIQGPCVGNQKSLAESRLWDSVGGFLMFYSAMQRKLSNDPSQIELQRDFHEMQNEMITMLLSMMEGNDKQSAIADKMVVMLIEAQQYFHSILTFYESHIKLTNSVTRDAFKVYDTNQDGWISPKEFRRAMAKQRFSDDEIEKLLLAVDVNHDGMIDYLEFTSRYHGPAETIAFNLVVLMTQLSQMASPEGQRAICEFTESDAGKFLMTHFQDELGMIEIDGEHARVERVYFKIDKSRREQWMSQPLQDAKSYFLNVVERENIKDKQLQFVDFCEDVIYEMRYNASLYRDAEK